MRAPPSPIHDVASHSRRHRDSARKPPPSYISERSCTSARSSQFALFEAIESVPVDSDHRSEWLSEHRGVIDAVKALHAFIISAQRAITSRRGRAHRAVPSCTAPASPCPRSARQSALHRVHQNRGRPARDVRNAVRAPPARCVAPGPDGSSHRHRAMARLSDADRSLIVVLTRALGPRGSHVSERHRIVTAPCADGQYLLLHIRSSYV